MYGRNAPSAPPQRTVWADKTKVALDDIRKRRGEIVRKLDDEEARAKEQCNHTYPDGRSAMKHRYDDEYNSYVSYCGVCGK